MGAVVRFAPARSETHPADDSQNASHAETQMMSPEEIAVGDRVFRQMGLHPQDREDFWQEYRLILMRSSPRECSKCRCRPREAAVTAACRIVDHHQVE